MREVDLRQKRRGKEIKMVKENSLETLVQDLENELKIKGTAILVLELFFQITLG